MNASLNFRTALRPPVKRALRLSSALMLLLPAAADASLFQGETLDSVADAIAKR